jgi:hypothetical protein
MRVKTGLLLMLPLGLALAACGDPAVRWAERIELAQFDRADVAEQQGVELARTRIDDGSVIYAPPPQLARDVQ